jgi:hypothetical protein
MNVAVKDCLSSIDARIYADIEPGPPSLVVSCEQLPSRARLTALRERATEGEPNPTPYPHGEASVALLSAPVSFSMERRACEVTRSVAGPLAHNAWIPAQGALHETIPLTAEDLVSLRRVSMEIDRMAIPAAHIDKLHDGGYIRDGRMGLVLTDLGQLRLKFERERLGAPK